MTHDTCPGRHTIQMNLPREILAHRFVIVSTEEELKDARLEFNPPRFVVSEGSIFIPIHICSDLFILQYVIALS